MDIDEQFPLLKMEEASSSDISSSEFSASANCANIDRQRGILWIGFRPKKNRAEKNTYNGFPVARHVVAVGEVVKYGLLRSLNAGGHHRGVECSFVRSSVRGVGW